MAMTMVRRPCPEAHREEQRDEDRGERERGVDHAHEEAVDAGRRDSPTTMPDREPDASRPTSSAAAATVRLTRAP